MAEKIAKEEAKKYRLVQGQSIFKLEIPESVEAKIRHLCSRVHDVEWSGTLFYKVEGSFDDGTFKATCLDICVMDIGTMGFTNFQDTADIISYRIDHPELLQPGVYEGLIHSHNNMSAFFSGTDVGTLLEEGSDLNHFLSLIVNNAGKYVARVTRKLVRKVIAKAHIVYTESSSYKTFENREIVLSSNKKSETDKTEEKSETIVEWYEMSIDKHEVPQPFKEVDSRLQEIKNRKTSYGKSNFAISTGGTTKIDYSSFGKSAYTPTTNRAASPNSPIVTTVSTPVKNIMAKETIQQPTLFSKEEMGEENLPLCLTESADDNVIENLCIQLLCGSVLIDSNSKLDIEQWVRKMDSLYEKRFGNLNNVDNCSLLEEWISLFVEMLLIHNPDPDFETGMIMKYNGEIDEADCVEIYAYDMIRFLDDLPASTVKQCMIDELKTYLPHGIEDYI